VQEASVSDAVVAQVVAALVALIEPNANIHLHPLPTRAAAAAALHECCK
jgi:hypothetical protein